MLQDTIAPSTDDRYAGYRALWLKVIIRAVFDWVSYRDSNRLPQKKYADSAYKWLFEPSELFNSFSNVCQFIDVSPEKIRVWARSMSKEQVAKIEHLERESSTTLGATAFKGYLNKNTKHDLDDDEFEDE